MLFHLIISYILIDVIAQQSSEKCVIVYVYDVSPQNCARDGLPSYILHSMQSVVQTQKRNCDIVLASNFKSCPSSMALLNNHSLAHQLILFDTSTQISQNTMNFIISSTSMYASRKDHLWLSSTTRFFVLQDIMNHFGFGQILHPEADNLLYGPVHTAWPILTRKYKDKLGFNPISPVFMTASCMWVGHVNALADLNNYLQRLANSAAAVATGNGTSRVDGDELWVHYIAFLRNSSDGVSSRSNAIFKVNGVGVKPYSINEMSMLHSYSLYINPVVGKTLPLFPADRRAASSSDNIPKATISTTSLTPSLAHLQASPEDSFAVWDSSWGQRMGGTAVKHGKDAGA